MGVAGNTNKVPPDSQLSRLTPEGQATAQSDARRISDTHEFSKHFHLPHVLYVLHPDSVYQGRYSVVCAAVLVAESVYSGGNVFLHPLWLPKRYSVVCGPRCTSGKLCVSGQIQAAVLAIMKEDKYLWRLTSSHHIKLRRMCVSWSVYTVGVLPDIVRPFLTL
ncbi:hypothetical protein Hamer_G014534 [Homarus americanus]|uniref:Uncharacterized protein n=1 Tax=Homarus americanus TaxID=6706 RepID=A0A8J5N4D0_HOMAM|nr:hypothetical protein Hamer_G014534 [Homarus americanus]